MSASGARLARALTSCVKSHCRLARADSLAHLGPNLCPDIPHQSDSFRRGTVGRGQAVQALALLVGLNVRTVPAWVFGVLYAIDSSKYRRDEEPKVSETRRPSSPMVIGAANRLTSASLDRTLVDGQV